MTELTRRSVLLGMGLCVVSGLQGCTRSASPAAPASPESGATPTASPSGSGTPAGASAAALPRVRPWSARAGEIAPSVKSRAVELVEGVGTWDAPAERHRGAARARTLGADSAAVAGLASLLGSGSASVVEVVDAQYGGILPTRHRACWSWWNQWVRKGGTGR